MTTLANVVQSVCATHNNVSPFARVERFPRSWGYADRGVFAYQIMNNEGKNIATYIPCMGAWTEQVGKAGEGREYTYPSEETEDISMHFPTKELCDG